VKWTAGRRDARRNHLLQGEERLAVQCGRKGGASNWTVTAHRPEAISVELYVPLCKFNQLPGVGGVAWNADVGSPKQPLRPLLSPLFAWTQRGQRQGRGGPQANSLAVSGPPPSVAAGPHRSVLALSNTRFLPWMVGVQSHVGKRTQNTDPRKRDTRVQRLPRLRHSSWRSHNRSTSSKRELRSAALRPAPAPSREQRNRCFQDACYSSDINPHPSGHIRIWVGLSYGGLLT
jgi:hypothetical protein